jgi:hypothetical protein
MMPKPVGDRFPDVIAAVLRRLKIVEQRVQVLDPGCFVVCYTGKIPVSYVSGDPTVVITGQTAAIGPLKVLGWYTPHAGDTVLLVPAGQTYIVAGTFS